MTHAPKFARRTLPQHPNDIRSLWQVNKYLWMTLGFLLAYLLIARAQGLLNVSMGVAWALFGLAVFDAGLRSYLAYRRGGYLPDRVAWCFTLLDVLLIAIAIRFTGGLNSDLWLVYFVVMIFESLYATTAQKRLINLVVAIAYLLATLPQQFHNLLPPVSMAAYWRIVASRCFFLVMVSSLGRRISRNAQARDHELSLLREQMATSEERARIAREVHDGLGHAMVSVILRLELCARLIRKAPEEAEALLKEEIPALRAAWNEGRDLAFHLRPWEAETNDLPEALRRHIARFAERTGMSVDFTVTGPDRPLRPETAFGLTRIVQEALTNAAKHARASRVEIALERHDPTGLRCSIRDNGCGFSLDEIQPGFGLQAMKERIEALGGKLDLQTAPGQGVSLEISIP